MAGCWFALCVLAVLSGYTEAQADGQYTEQDLYSSEVWRSGARAVLVREQGASTIVWVIFIYSSCLQAML